MFGFIDDALDAVVNIADTSIDMALAVVTLGEYGELSKENVTRLIVSGITIYEISELTGVAVELINGVLED